MRCRRPCNGHHCNNSSCTESIVSSTHTRMITQRMHDQTRQVRGDAAAVVQRAQRAQSVQAVSSLSADVSSLLIASCPHHITQSEIGSHTLTRLQPSPMSENRNANALPQAFPFVTLRQLLRERTKIRFRMVHKKGQIPVSDDPCETGFETPLRHSRRVAVPRNLLFYIIPMLV